MYREVECFAEAHRECHTDMCMVTAANVSESVLGKYGSCESQPPVSLYTLQ